MQVSRRYATSHSRTGSTKSDSTATIRRRALLEGLESRVLFANTLLYFDADGNTSAATGGTGTWDSTSLVWRLGSPTGTLQAWNNADPSTTTAVFGGTAGTVTVAAGTTIHANAVQALTTAYTVNRANSTAFLHLSGTTPAVDTGALSLTINSVVTGTASLTKIGAGTLVLGGANTFSGGLVIKNGTVGSPGISTAFGTGAVTLGDTTGSNSATLAVSGSSGGSITFANSIIVPAGNTGVATITNTTVGAQVAQNETFTGAITLNHDLVVNNNRSSRNFTFSGAITGSSKLTFSGAASNSINIVTGASGASFTGNVAIQSGTLQFGNGSLGNGSGTITFAASSTLSWASGNTQDVSSRIQPIASGVTATLDTGANNVTFASPLSATGGTFTKTGTGSLTLAGTSSYAATTSVTNGALIVNGALGGASNVAVSSTGVLGGSGSIGKPVSITGTGTIDAGNSSSGTGALSTRNLSLTSTSTFRAQVNGSVIGDSFDQVNVTGTVTLGSSILSLSGTRTASEGHQITLIRNDGTDAVVGTFAGKAEGSTLTVNGVTYSISYVGGTGNDVVLTDLTTGALFNDSPFGLSIDSTRGKNFASWVPQMATAGSRWVRGLPVGWGVVESTQGTFNFSVPDAQLAVANTNNTYLIGTLVNAPAWTGEAGKFPVNHLTEWGNYVTQLVTHYSPTVKYWEVWNEPPNYSTNGTSAQYAQLVSAAYTAAKAVDSTAQVGIAGSSVNIQFIKEAIQNGAAGKYDYITLHPYEMLGSVRSADWEPMYLSIVSNVRKMLAEVDPTKVNVPIIFTEIGAVLGANLTQTTQASLLVKTFAMNGAMGVKQTDWFEGRDGDSGQFGLLDASGNPRIAYTALTQMIDYLGQYPQYLGWVRLNNNNWGFVFQGQTENVLVTWAPTGTTDSITLSASATIVDPLTGTTTTGSSFTLGDTPKLVVGVPSDIVTLAKANKNQPYPWGGDYSGATSVDFTPNNATKENGLHVLGSSSNYTTAYGETVYNAGNSSLTGFGVDPNFLSYDHTPITITVVARRKEANASAGFNLKYESMNQTQYKNSSASWWTIPGNTQWYTKTYTISDPQFVGFWAYNFRLDSDSTGNSQYYIKSITVTKSGSLLARSGSSTSTTPTSKTIQYAAAPPSSTTTLSNPSAFFSRSIATGLFSDEDINQSPLAAI